MDKKTPLLPIEYLKDEELQTELRETRVRESNHKFAKDDDMTNTLKIPGKFVGIACDDTGGVFVATETQVYNVGDFDLPLLQFDITDYQDKPTEKELEVKKDKEEMRKNMRVFLLNFINSVMPEGLYNQEDAPAIIASIEALNKMDEREE